MNAIRVSSDNARDPLEAIRALDSRLPHAMQCADLHLLDAVRSDLAQRWGDGDRADVTDRRA
ncbi:MAG: hypothetical protein ABL934_10410 [Lysobacteraceae bacterium]